MKTERRQHERQRVSLPVRVRVLAEEETFTPFQYDGCAVSLTPAGAMITISDIAAEEYEVVFRRPRFLRIQCRFPAADAPSVMFGRVVWHDFDRAAAPAICRTAVAFEPLKEKDHRLLRRFLENDAESD